MCATYVNYVRSVVQSRALTASSSESQADSRKGSYYITSSCPLLLHAQKLHGGTETTNIAKQMRILK